MTSDDSGTADQRKGGDGVAEVGRPCCTAKHVGRVAIWGCTFPRARCGAQSEMGWLFPFVPLVMHPPFFFFFFSSCARNHGRESLLFCDTSSSAHMNLTLRAESRPGKAKWRHHVSRLREVRMRLSPRFPGATPPCDRQHQSPPPFSFRNRGLRILTAWAARSWTGRRPRACSLARTQEGRETQFPPGRLRTNLGWLSRTQSINPSISQSGAKSYEAPGSPSARRDRS